MHRGTAKLIVTSRGFYATRQTRSALTKAVLGACIRSAGFKAIFILEAEGNVQELAEQVVRACAQSIGHVTAVLAEVQSTSELIRAVAVKIGTDHIGEHETFCFRLHKRGSHWLEQGTPELEYEIGGAIWVALQQKYGKKPQVDLKSPDITITAEVLGLSTAVGILRRSWRVSSAE